MKEFLCELGRVAVLLTAGGALLAGVFAMSGRQNVETDYYDTGEVFSRTYYGSRWGSGGEADQQRWPRRIEYYKRDGSLHHVWQR